MEGTHIKFVETPEDARRKTKIWWVVSKHDETQLGWIAWFGRWRKYAYYPKPETVYEEVCLREIAQFCVNQTLLHKEKNKHASV